MADEQTISQQPLSALLEGVRRPIPGDNPCGRDISYEEDFLSIKAEIDKMNTVGGQIDQERAAELRQLMDSTRGTVRKTERAEAEKQLDQRGSVVRQGSGPDYQFIRQTAVRVLTEKSKDLRIASYLCFALWQQESFAGLAEGLCAIDILIQNFWDGLYPGKARPVARRAALDFLTAKLDDSVVYAQVRETDRAPLERAKDSLKNLQQQFNDKMPEGPPSFLGLTQAVEKSLNKVPRPAAPKPSVSEPSAPSLRPSLSEAAPAAAPPRTEIQTSSDATNFVKQAAKFFRTQDPKSAVSYRLLRSLRWDPILNLPPNENGKTRVEPPQTQGCNLLRDLREKREWTTLLEECEIKFGQPGFYFWLDMQRWVVDALDGLGAEFKAARAAVLSELAQLIQRIPKLSALSFSDGTRFADPATVAWMDDALASAQSSSGPGVPRPPSVQTGDEGDAQLVEAKRAFEAGDLVGAVILLSSPSADSSRKSLFRRKLAMATFCMRGGQPAIARPLLEELEQEIERFSIHEWEPRLALEALTALNRCYETLAAGPVNPAKEALQRQSEKVFERICRLDIAFALASAGVKPAPKRAAALAPPPQPTSQPTNGNDNGTKVNKEPTTHQQP